MEKNGGNAPAEQEYSVQPLSTVAGFPVRPGMYGSNGAVELPYGVSFTVYTHNGTGCELLLFKNGETEPYAILPFPREYRIGDVYSMIVFGLNIHEFEYAYRVDGPYDEEKGIFFNRRNILLDPYARSLAGRRVWGKKKEGVYHARVVRDSFDWGTMPQSRRSLSDLVIYELHVRGFTRHPSSKVKNPGTFAGLMEKIPYLKELGINAVELMPIFEFDENLTARVFNEKTLLDYWGYNTVSFFAPNSSYTSAEDDNEEGAELKHLIRGLHQNGIEVILDVVFNHTAEGNERGKTINFKGFDNNIYYMLTPEGNYFNFSGCGNTFNCNNPVVRRFITDCLRHWVINYRVDGFRFDLASILGRNEDGSPMMDPPLPYLLATDPILSNVKLIAEAWDAGGMYQVGKFPAHKRWAEWNGRYRDTMRSFLKGACWEAYNAAWSICGSGDLYGDDLSVDNTNYAGLNSCINFFTCHDGFTLYDLYSYNEKHNWNNGWNNTDGSDDNRSWNCGCEGETDNQDVRELRFRMIRNACAVLMCSRGTPMFLAGDEFGNTQYGNNNCYCQDNEMSWLDWDQLEQNRDLFGFFQYMIAFRHRHPVIRKKLPDSVSGFVGVHTHNIYAEKVPFPHDARTFSVSFTGYNTEVGRDDLVYLSINTYWEDVTISLPNLKGAGKWYMAVNTYGDGHGRYYYPEGQEILIHGDFMLRPRTVAIFVAKRH